MGTPFKRLYACRRGASALRRASNSSRVVRWLKLTRKEARAFFRERLTAKTARLGRASEEQADFTEMQISAAASVACTAEPRLPAMLRFRM